MANYVKGLITAVGAFMLLAAPTLANAQEDCHRGTLDVAYCDRNLDPLANLPPDQDFYHNMRHLACRDGNLLAH